MENLFEQILLKKELVKNKYNQNVNIDSIMIKDGCQTFSHFYKEDSLHEMRSISKVLIALAYGIVLGRGQISLDTFVYPIIKNVVDITNLDNIEKIKKWQIKHLLTYSCGYESQMFSERFIKEIEPKNYLNYVVNFNLVYEPGEKYIYNNADIFLLSVCFQEMFNKNIKDFVCEEIFEPLNIKNFKWDNYDKYCPGGTGLYIAHKDLFKIGELILNKGKHNNNQIVSSKYIEEMCSIQIETPYATKPERVLPKVGVGFVMHISRDGYAYKDGTNGQYLIINFEKQQLLTILSSEPDMSCVTEILRDLI
jgi:CubicO group peptidase (beta-lactamase class C family)